MNDSLLKTTAATPKPTLLGCAEALSDANSRLFDLSVQLEGLLIRVRGDAPRPAAEAMPTPDPVGSLYMLASNIQTLQDHLHVTANRISELTEYV